MSKNIDPLSTEEPSWGEEKEETTEEEERAAEWSWSRDTKVKCNVTAKPLTSKPVAV